MRLFFIFFLFGHGFFHALGFARIFDPDVWPTEPITRELGLFWLAACILFLATGYGFASNHRRWWMTGFTAVVVSQTLVIVEWNTAAWGTLPNAFVFLICLISYMNWKFEIKAKREADDLRVMAMNRKTSVSPSNYERLPGCVQRWMDWSGARTASIPDSAYLTQEGRLRLKEKADWLPFNAEQWFSLSEPGFIWLAKVGEGKLMRFMGRDAYRMTKGNMLIKAFGILKVADESGPVIDQGSAVRYLSELVWFPHMAMSGQIAWEEIDEHSAKATLHHGEPVGGRFYFDETGRPQAFTALRYNSRTGKKEEWEIRMKRSEYLEKDGVRIPSQADVVWRLDSGDFHWLDLEVRSIEFLTHHKYKEGPGKFEPALA
jgi:hypothetical protein